MLWPLQAECAAKFGNPSDPGWANKNLTYIVPPFPMHMGDLPITRIAVNKICSEALAHVFNIYWDKIGKDPGVLRKDGVDIFSGTWNIRTMRGLKATSMHSYALALDLNAPVNPLGRKPGMRQGSFTRDSLIVKCFYEVDAVWGGVWGRPDGMHFQFARC
jgi:hypothetical protein